MTSLSPDRRLELQGYEWFVHFQAPIILLGLTTFSIVKIAIGGYDWNRVAIVPMVLGVIALLALWSQMRALRFRVFNTSHSASENFEMIIAGIEGSDWVITEFKEDALLELKTPGFPATWLSWGEQVTLLFENELVYVNSICDPDKLASLSAFGRNSRNIRRIGAMLSIELTPGAA